MAVALVDEVRGVELGDERLNRRLGKLIGDLGAKPNLSIPAATETRNEMEAAYRFFDNKKVSPEKILQPHVEATYERISQTDLVLLVQDTTELDLTRPNQQVEGAGPMDCEARRGAFVHPLLAFDSDGLPLGTVWQKCWAREQIETTLSKSEKCRKRQKTPIEEKESFRWLKGYRQGCELADQVPDTKVVVISDSEGDIFECFTEAQQNVAEQKADWIVRACQDRSLPNQDGDHENLWAEVGSTKILGTMDVEVSKNQPKSTDKQKRNQSRSARTATMTIQATCVTLKGPQRPGGKLADVKVNAILVRETNPPKDEKPVEWLLLTSLPVKTFKQVCLVIDYYCCRWQIEIYFRVLKSGCRVEELQLETAERFEPCLALYMIVAWRVMYLLMMGRECPEMSCDLVFSEDEWKAVYTVVQQETPPKQAPTLEEMVYLIASLGGHLGRTHDGPPGPKTMWIGMQRMTDLALAWRTFGPAKTPTRKRKICV